MSFSGTCDLDKRDFDDCPLLQAESGASQLPTDSQQRGNRHGSRRGGFLSDLVAGIVERDRRLLGKETIRVCSFVCAVINCLCAGSITSFSLYGPLFLSRLHYTQLRVNTVAIAAEIGMYLPIPLSGYLCDRYTPSPSSLAAAILFGAGYLLAAFTYKNGPPPDAGGSGWPFWVMVLAFAFVGTGTCCMYLSAVTTCAKNFSRFKYRGIMLAIPITALGLSGIWESQVGTYLLSERLDDGSRGEIDVFRYFVFLALLLLGAGLVGAVGLRLVNDKEEDQYINEAMSELERSGILEASEFFRSREEVRAAYDTFQHSEVGDYENEAEEHPLSRADEVGEREKGWRKKNWLLNQETRLFLQDHTMWLLAGGFFLITGPSEAYINNLGTIIQSLTPALYPVHTTPLAGLPSTHVSIMGLTSTLARLLTGSLSDVFAPPATHHHIYSSANPDRQPVPEQARRSLSRLVFLFPCVILLSCGFLLLASPFTLHHPQLFHLTSALVGIGYGGAFALAPIIVSIVWGAENFGTNWGIVAMVPAGGATLWGIIYSRAYEDAAAHIPLHLPDGSGEGGSGQCIGWRCYGFWALGCALSVWVAIAIWTLAWRGWRRRGVVV